MTAVSHTETIRAALHDGLEYFGHELDDVTGRVHAVTPQAKRFEAALSALAALETELDEARKACNICGEPWPTHIKACAYPNTFADLRAAERALETARAVAQAVVDVAPGYTAKRGSIWALDHKLDALRDWLAGVPVAAAGREADDAA